MSFTKPPKNLFALVDCNNFYASCERVFNPQLIGKPLVVLSNNDGCVIARSKEAKILGVPMGAPAFQYAELFKRHRVIVRSSNFALYGDMSHRVMQTLEHFSQDMQIYSIDEAFLDLSHIDDCKALADCKEIRSTVLQWTGIPVSIGIAPTKTLAKAANLIAKKSASLEGVFSIDLSQNESILKNIPVEEIWGIGRRMTNFLNRHSIKFAWDFATAKDDWIKKHLNIVGLRTAWELRGISCLPLEQLRANKKSITTSRSFSYRVTSLEELSEAIASYTAHAAEKLRDENSLAGALEVFLTTGTHGENSYYSNQAHIKIPQPTSFTPALIQYAKKGLQCVYRPGFLYKKVGVTLHDLVSENCFQQDLFVRQGNLHKQQTLMQLMDEANRRYGRNTLKFAAEGLSQQWKMKQDKRSPCYTTRWEDLLTIHI